MMEELQTIELQINKRFFVLVGTVMLVGSTAYALLPTTSILWQRWGFSVLFAVLGIWEIVGVLVDKPYLKLTPLYLETRIHFRTRKIRWVNILGMAERSARGYRFIRFSYLQEHKIKNSVRKQNWMGSQDTLINSSTLKFDDFRDLVFWYWEHSKRNPAFRASQEVPETQATSKNKSDQKT